MLSVSLLVVVLAGAYLVVLGLAALLTPALASRFLLGFAQSPARHCLELTLRVLVGAALVTAAPVLPHSRGYAIFGWILLLTTLLLACVPWRLHARLAQASVARAARFLPVVAIVSLAAGVAMLASVRAATTT